MAFVPVENVAQVNLQYAAPNGQTVENIIYFLRSIAWTATALADLLEAVETAWEVNIRPQQSNQVALKNLVARDLTEEFGLQEERAIVPNLAGDQATAALPQNVSLAIKFTTPFVGRSFRGRIYQIGLYEAGVTGDFVGTSPAASMLLGWLDFAEDVEAAEDIVHVVVSRVSGGVQRTAGVATPVTGYGLTDTRVDTQRRRLPFEGS